MLLLASGSARRAQLLTQIGVSFSQLSPNIIEEPKELEAPEKYVQRLARQKGEAALHIKPEATVLSADTLIKFNHEIMEKPRNQGHAFEMLKALSNSKHQVMTAVSLINARRELLCLVCTEVTFKALSDDLIKRYLETGEYKGKAGSYAIQGFAGGFVEQIQGSYSNVVGLPLAETVDMLDAFSIPYWQTGLI